MNRKETLPWVIFRTMEFWLMSSGKVAVGLRTEMASGWFNIGEDVRGTSFAKMFDVQR